MQDKNYFKEFFTYSKRELRGIVVLAVLIGLLIIIRLAMHSTNEKFDLVYETKTLRKDTLNSSREILDKNQCQVPAKLKSLTKNEKIDPNHATYMEFIHHGFSKKSTSNIIKYREKGGVFHRPEDLLKIYATDTSFIRSILSNISISPGSDKNIKSKSSIQLYSKPIVEINSADSSKLLIVNGIGIILSKRIIKYRSLIGGFSNINQLREVYGVSDSLFSLISEQVVLDTNLIRKININKCTFYDLRKHPYIDDYTAKTIINYRKLMGSIDSIQQLIENHLITKENFKKVAPYISLN